MTDTKAQPIFISESDSKILSAAIAERDAEIERLNSYIHQLKNRTGACAVSTCENKVYGGIFDEGLKNFICLTCFNHKTQIRDILLSMGTSRSQIERLREALKPFATFGELWLKKPPRQLGNEIYTFHGVHGSATISVSDCVSAYRLLKAGE